MLNRRAFIGLLAARVPWRDGSLAVLQGLGGMLEQRTCFAGLYRDRRVARGFGIASGLVGETRSPA